MKKMRITHTALFEMLDHLGGQRAEAGGYLFGRDDGKHLVEHYVPDTDAQTTSSTYTMNTDFINPVIKKLWDEEGLMLLGIAHSHPQGYKQLSDPDREYFTGLLSKIERDTFYTPILQSIPDGRLDIIPWVWDSKSGQTLHAELEITHDVVDDQNTSGAFSWSRKSSASGTESSAKTNQHSGKRSKRNRHKSRDSSRRRRRITNLPSVPYDSALRVAERTSRTFAYLTCAGAIVYLAIRTTPHLAQFIIENLQR